MGIEHLVRGDEERSLGEKQYSGPAVTEAGADQKGGIGTKVFSQAFLDGNQPVACRVGLPGETYFPFIGDIDDGRYFEVVYGLAIQVSLDEERIVAFDELMGIIPFGPVFDGPFDGGEFAADAVKDQLHVPYRLLFFKLLETFQDEDPGEYQQQ